MVLTVYGIEKKWWKDLEHSPLLHLLHGTYDMAVPDICGSDSEEDEPLMIPERTGAAASASAAEVPKTVKESNAELRKVRGQHKNTMHFTCTVMSNIQKFRRIDGVQEVQYPMVTLTKTKLTETHTRGGTLNFFTQLAEGLFGKTVMDCWLRLQNLDVLERLDFNMDASAGPLQLEKDQEVADVMFQTAVSLSRDFLKFDLEHTHALPLYLARLVTSEDTDDPAIQEASNTNECQTVSDDASG